MRQALRNKLTHGLYIVSVDTHYIAVVVRIEIFNRKLLHMSKQIAPEIGHYLLRHKVQKLRLCRGSRNTDEVHAAHSHNKAYEFVPHRAHAAGVNSRRDYVVHNVF